MNADLIACVSEAFDVSCEGLSLDAPSELDPSLMSCELHTGGKPNMLINPILNHNGNSINTPSRLDDPVFSLPDCPVGKQSPISYNRNICIESTNDYRFRWGGEQKVLITPTTTAIRHKSPGARILQVYTHWIKGSSIRITTRQEQPHGTCLASARISAAQFVRAFDQNFNGRNIPMIRKPDYSQEVKFGQLLGFERLYQDLKLNTIPDATSNTTTSDRGFNVVTYDVSSVADDEWVVTHDVIIIRTEIYATKAKGTIEISIQASDDFVARCWDPSSS